MGPLRKYLGRRQYRISSEQSLFLIRHSILDELFKCSRLTLLKISNTIFDIKVWPVSLLTYLPLSHISCYEAVPTYATSHSLKLGLSRRALLSKSPRSAPGDDHLRGIKVSPANMELMRLFHQSLIAYFFGTSPGAPSSASSALIFFTRPVHMRPMNSASYMLMSCTTAPGSRVQNLRDITLHRLKSPTNWMRLVC